MLTSLPAMLLAAGAGLLVGLLLGGLLTRRRWRRAFVTMRGVFQATLAGAEEVIADQDQRLDILEEAAARNAAGPGASTRPARTEPRPGRTARSDARLS